MKNLILTLSIIPNFLLGQMKVHTSGNVSVGGETTPRAILDINQNTATSTTAQFGMFGIQSFASTNGFLTGNSFWNGSAMQTYNAGNISLLQFLPGSILFRTSAVLPAGGTAAGSTLFNNIVASDNGYVGINMPNSSRIPAYSLHVTGEAAKTSGGTDWIAISDRNLKKNIVPFTDGLQKVMEIKPYFFEYTGEAGTTSGQTYIGLMAQDMEKIAPYTVKKFKYIPTKNANNILEAQPDFENCKEFLALDNTAVRYMLVNAIQEQQAIINDLIFMVNQLEAKVIDLTKSEKLKYDSIVVQKN